MDLTQQLRDAADDARPVLRPPAQARLRAERARRRRRAAAGGGAVLVAAAVAAVTFSLQVPQPTVNQPAVPSTSAPAPTTAAVTTSQPVVPPPSTAPATTTTTTTTTTTDGTQVLGALDPPDLAAAGFVTRPWKDRTLSFGMLNSHNGDQLCIAPAQFLRGSALAEHEKQLATPTGADYEILWGNAPSSCYTLDADTRIYGRALFTDGGDPSWVRPVTVAQLMASFKGMDKEGDALWPVWYKVGGAGHAGDPLRYLGEQYDPEDLRMSGN